MRNLLKMSVSMMLFATIVAGTQARAEGGREGGNGGDPNEMAFMDVARNIADWIRSGNASRLELPSNLTFDSYKNRMLAVIAQYHITFTDQVVRVAGVEKTCRNFRDSRSRNQIVCNSERFTRLRSQADDLYRIVHHEFAGLAGLEANNGQDSSYGLSDQISGFLEIQTVMRLPIVPQEQRDSHQFFGNYRLETNSSMARYLGLENLIVKEVSFHNTIPMIVTLKPGDEFSEINAPVTWDAEKQKYVFKLEVIDWCEGPDCEGLSDIDGEITQNAQSQETVTLRAGFFRANYPNLRNWTETLVYKRD